MTENGGKKKLILPGQQHNVPGMHVDPSKLDANGRLKNKKFVVGEGNNDPIYPQSREKPEMKIKEIYARTGGVVVAGTEGDRPVQQTITRREAILRARAINEMIPGMTYSSDVKEAQRIVEMFVNAITKAKEQEGQMYKSVSVSMATASINKEGAFAPKKKKGKGDIEI